jgi:hypothetical protein
VHGLEIALAGDREAGFDHVDAHVFEQFGDFDLFFERHRGAGALLAVAQGRVEDDDPVLGRGRVGIRGHSGLPYRVPDARMAIRA